MSELTTSYVDQNWNNSVSLNQKAAFKNHFVQISAQQFQPTRNAGQLLLEREKVITWSRQVTQATFYVSLHCDGARVSWNCCSVYISSHKKRIFPSVYLIVNSEITLLCLVLITLCAFISFFTDIWSLVLLQMVAKNISKFALLAS